jgi:hypothetical protein
MTKLYQQLNQSQLSRNNNSNGGLQQMINMVSRSNNPMQLMQTMAQSNPQLQSILNLIQTSQKSPKDLFFEMAQQRGVDPQQILQMLQH